MTKATRDGSGGDRELLGPAPALELNVEGASGSSLTQPPLPILRQLMRSAEQGGFAHPAEADFSRILTYYGVRWVYEPTTFALAWAADGRPRELFTPDFYLPDHQLYIELTTMRQRLVTRKNRKLRRLRELYPNVRIKLLYRRDYLRLLDSYPGPACPSCDYRVGPVYFSAERIEQQLETLADSIAGDLALSQVTAASPVLVLGVGRGSRRFHSALMGALEQRQIGVDGDRVELTRYRVASGVGRVRVARPPLAPLAGRRVLVVEDVVSTGLSLAYLMTWLRRRGVASLAVCCLLDRRGTRLVEVPIDYVGFEAPNELLVGYGLALRKQFSDLPCIAAVEPI